jgi:hypothetical protein
VVSQPNFEQSYKGKVKTHKYTVGIVLLSSGTSQLGMFDIQATTKSKYYDHIVLLYLESRRCRQILQRQTSRFHYDSKVPAVTITIFITILEQNR